MALILRYALKLELVGGAESGLHHSTMQILEGVGCDAIWSTCSSIAEDGRVDGNGNILCMLSGQ
jgi:hypothetical protein